MKTNEAAVIVTRSFDLPKSRIWNAITSHPEMVQWYFEDLPEFQALTGFKTSFEVRSEQRVFTHQWEVVEVIREKKISYTWSYKEYPGNSLLTMELKESGKSTLLMVTHKTTSDFMDNIPEFDRESCLAGWNYLIKEQLDSYLSFTPDLPLKTPKLETQRLTLETTNLAHAPFLFRLMNSEDWIRYIGDRNIRNLKDAEAYIKERMFPQLETHGHTNFIINLKESEQPVGVCGLYVRDGLDTPDLGFALLPEYRKQGFAFEACSELLDFGFRELQLNTILAITLPVNQASISLLERLGFQFLETFKLPGDPKNLLKFAISDC